LKIDFLRGFGRMLGSFMSEDAHPARAIALVAVLAGSAYAGGGATYHGPTPYLQASDAPDIFPNRILEDFEDGTLTIGMSADNGVIVGPGGLTDSVDGDDGSIDGGGSNGRSWFHSP